MSELLCECCPMTVDQALEAVESGRPGRRQRHAAWELAKEVRRLRAVYERIAEIPAIGLSCGEPTIARQHVLRAISGEKYLPWMEDYATVCKERDRLRAAVEAVRALPTYDLEGPSWDGRMIIRDDVLAALEVSGDD